MLTAARSGEVLGARWSEIDPVGAVWTLPAERMKAAKAHHVPLGARCLEILAGLPRIAGNDHLFPAGGPLGGRPLNRLRLLPRELGDRAGRDDQDARQHPLRRHPGRDAGIQAMDGKRAATTNLIRSGVHPSTGYDIVDGCAPVTPHGFRSIFRDSIVLRV